MSAGGGTSLPGNPRLGYACQVCILLQDKVVYYLGLIGHRPGIQQHQGGNWEVVVNCLHVLYQCSYSKELMVCFLSVSTTEWLKGICLVRHSIVYWVGRYVAASGWGEAEHWI